MSLIERLKAFLSGTPTPPRTRDATPTPNTDEDAGAGTSSEAAASPSTSSGGATPDAPAPRTSSPSPQGTPSTPEHATQFAEASDGQDRDILDLVIGFDWGTSCTKVVIRDPYGSNVSYAVPLDGSDQATNPYLLPSTLYLDAEGRAHLPEDPHCTALSSLKIDVMDGIQAVGSDMDRHGPVRPEGAAALFIAAVVRRARQWFLERWSERYRQFHIEWQLNLGIPAASYDDRERCAHFKLIARIAWQLSTREGPLTIDAARRAFEQARTTGVAASETTPVTHVVPEVAAQVVGYAKSTLRREGLHVLVDVGASTFDVAAFNLHQREGEDTYSIYTTCVTRDGAFALHRARLDYIDEYAHQLSAPPLGEHRRPDPMCLVPYDLAAYFPETMRREVRRLVGSNGEDPDDPDSRFQKRCCKTLRQALESVWSHRYPDAPAWKSGLPIFTCGGGRDLAPYGGALRDVNAWFQRYKPKGTLADFNVSELPRPEDLFASGTSEDRYHRLSVAYGLSFPIWDIGQLRPPGDIPDVPTLEETAEHVFHEDTKAWT